MSRMRSAVPLGRPASCLSPLHLLLCLFSLIGNYYYTESNLRFIRDDKRVLFIFRLTCLAAIFLGAQASFDTVWNLADILMGFMAIVNIIAILLLGNQAVKVLKDYDRSARRAKTRCFLPAISA